MKKIIMLKGLPASGKTSYSYELMEKHPGVYKHINKDSLRLMLDNSKWSKDNEKMVENVRDFIILQALENGFTPIIDDTNFSPRHFNHIQELTKEWCKKVQIPRAVELEIKEFDVSLDECIKRDLQRSNSVGEKVIKQMYNQFVKPKSEVYSRPDLPKAVIFDIDGTLTLGGLNRSPYEWAKVGNDLPNKPIIELLDLYRNIGYNIIIVSGRDSICRPETEQWLKDNNICYNNLYMRQIDDNRKDTIIKREIFDEHIREIFNVITVVDDRACVVEMWRDMGLTVFQVNEGDF